jgi:hypothetical protein
VRTPGVCTFFQAKRFGTDGNEGNKERKKVGNIFAEMRHASLERNGLHGSKTEQEQTENTEEHLWSLCYLCLLL